MFKSFATVGLLAAFAEALDLAASNYQVEEIIDLVTGDDGDKQEHDPLSCIQETQFRGLPTQPACPSGYDMFGLSCLKHC